MKLSERIVKITTQPEKRCEVLRDFLIFQQDSAVAHWARDTAIFE